MQNLTTYLTFLKNITFKQLPFNELDALLFALLSYIRFKGIVPGDAQSVTLQKACQTHQREVGFEENTASPTFSAEILKILPLLCASKRYANIKLSHYYDEINHATTTQFGAISFTCPRYFTYVAFRGTDNSMVGWKENLRMIYNTQLVAHNHAKQYLEHVIQDKHKWLWWDKCVASHKIIVGGHSKGGNLAMAAVYQSTSLHPYIEQVYAFDSPGFLPSFYQQYHTVEIAKKMVNYVPTCSLIGRFLWHEENICIVQSSAKALLQHDTFTWLCDGEGWMKGTEFDAYSNGVHTYIHELLFTGDLKLKEATLYKMFSMLDRMQLYTLNDISAMNLNQGFIGMKEFMNMTSEERKFFTQLLTFIIKQTRTAILNKVKS